MWKCMWFRWESHGLPVIQDEQKHDRLLIAYKNEFVTLHGSHEILHCLAHRWKGSYVQSFHSVVLPIATGIWRQPLM